tara:strand:+ start:910 stop:1014 length:105 start_codon:yes stop_codon:yes gene_type:complete
MAWGSYGLKTNLTKKPTKNPIKKKKKKKKGKGKK